MGVLITNGTVVTDKAQWVGDILCREGRIAALGMGLEKQRGDVVVDAAGQYVFPGGIDPHVHMELAVKGEGGAGLVSADDFETGTAAGLAGGTTTIIDFVHPERGQEMLEALRARHAQATKSVVDYAFHMAVTSWSETAREGIERCVRDQGIPSLKAYMAYRATVGIDEAGLLAAMQTARELDALVMVHAEDGDAIDRRREALFAEGKTAPRFHAVSRPPESEYAAVRRLVELARMTGARTYVVHVSCAESAHAIAEARSQGLKILGETCPQYLLLDDSVYEKSDLETAACVMSPPIRPRAHQEALWTALSGGNLQVVATDHCPFDSKGGKDRGLTDFRAIPSGAAGIEHRLSLLYTYGVRSGRLSVQQFVDCVSVRPAKVFGLYPRKGSIRIGADADLVVWDAEATGCIRASTHRHRCDTSIFEGWTLRGMPSTVVAGGRVQYRNGKLDVKRGGGRYLPRIPAKDDVL
ncbi:MAG: dihydropyrimidinase [Planctomycetota bacterium]